MPNLGAGEILVILLVALLVLGPDKLPSAARSVGRTMSQIRKLSRGFEDEVRGAMKMADIDTATPSPASSPAPSPSGSLHPGLGSGPKLEAGAVDLGGSPPTPGPTPSPAPATDTSNPVGSQGPTESFS